MYKNFFFLGAVLWAFSLSTLPSFSTGISLESLSEESIPGLVRQYPRVIPHVKHLMRSLPGVLFKAELGPVMSFKTLDFEALEKQFFPQGAWHPHRHHFKEEALQEVFKSYVPQSFPEDKHLIFLANVLYETGKGLYQKNSEDVLFLESAAAIGHPKAQLEMSWVADRKDKLEEAKNYVFRAAAQGDTEALLELSKLYDWGFGNGICPQDRKLAKRLCQEAALLQNSEAIFRIDVATYTDGMFGEPRNFQQGVLNAKKLAEAGNERAKEFIESVFSNSRDGLEEGRDYLTDADFDFLRSLGWRDTWDEQDEVYLKMLERD
jgi:hypothetical protein